MEEIIEYEQLPVGALRGMVAFPHVTMHFEAGREKSIRAVDKAMKADQRVLLLLAQFANFSGVGRLTGQGLGQTRTRYK